MVARFFLFGALLCRLVWAEHPCAELIAPALDNLNHPVRYYKTNTRHTRFADVLPNYNPKTDFIMNFQPGAHADLFVGPLFVHTNYQAIQPRRRKSIPPGVHVVVRVGEEKIQRMLTFIEEKHHYNCWGFSCHHNAILLLQRNGVRLRDYVPLLGQSTYSKVVREGFVDENGNPFPQEIVVVHHEGTDPLLELIRNLKYHEALRLPTMLAIGGMKEEANAWAAAQGGLVAVIFEAYQTKNFANVPPEARELVGEFGEIFEIELLTIAEAHGGSQALLEAHALREFDRELLKTAIRTALVNTVKQMQHRFQ